MEWVTNKSSGNSDGTGDNIVRLRGLPFDCTEPDIVKFFQGENSITFLFHSVVCDDEIFWEGGPP